MEYYRAGVWPHNIFNLWAYTKAGDIDEQNIEQQLVFCVEAVWALST